MQVHKQCILLFKKYMNRIKNDRNDAVRFSFSFFPLKKIS
jgi:hypothetical protein